MYIITCNNNIADIREKYIVLELDTFSVDDKYIPTFCVIDMENINFNNLATLNNMKELHGNLIKNYKIGNWKYCINAIKHLRGKFGKGLDGFYDIFGSRIADLRNQTLPANWTGAIIQSK